jgi:hypothetical protein
LKDLTYKALCELLTAAEDTIPVFDGLTNHGWIALNANDRRERLRKAIAAMRKTVRQEALIAAKLAEIVSRNGGCRPASAQQVHP